MATLTKTIVTRTVVEKIELQFDGRFDDEASLTSKIVNLILFNRFEKPHVLRRHLYSNDYNEATSAIETLTEAYELADKIIAIISEPQDGKTSDTIG